MDLEPEITSMKAQERTQLLQLLQSRFEQNRARHEAHKWSEVQARLEENRLALKALREMEVSGGEPDVIDNDKVADQFIFCDCSAESPSGRRSLCYDLAALNSRKNNKPAGSAAVSAAAMGIELLNEQQYRRLQQVGEFDTKTSSWLSTPDDIRGLGGAIFGDRRYGQVFIYHNGAESYYAARGFRGLLRV